MNKERLMKVLLAPISSEKSHRIANENNQITFKVATDATKIEIKNAVELLFDVKVDRVQVINSRGKQVRFGQNLGMTKNWKKAYVQLAAGHDIDFASAEA